MSTNIGLKPLIKTEFISETQVKVGTITSFFFRDMLFKINMDKKFAEYVGELAELNNIILSFKNGFFTNPVEEGILLSGGQIQRLAIATVF